MKTTKFFSGLILFSVFTFTLNVGRIYDPSSKEKFKISRSKLELFLKCPRCFYLDCKHGISQPRGFPFTLNNAVDKLLKKEFDAYRAEQKSHPLIVKNNLKLIPLKHVCMDTWRDALRAGIQYDVPETNLRITGGIDDVWINPDTQELFIVDYKATCKAKFITPDDLYPEYKRQVEIYQWLFRKNDFKVSNTAYFVYCNGIISAEKFDNCLNFKISLIPYEGNDSWVDKVIVNVYKCLQTPIIPFAGQDCELCDCIKRRSAVPSKALMNKK